MNFKEKFNQIKAILGIDVKLASEKLVDGTILEAEEFEVGYPLFVVNEDSTKSPAPAGIHETESGKLVEVDEAGTIVSISEKESEVEVEAEVEETVEVEMESIIGDVVPEVEVEAGGVPVIIQEALKDLVMAVESITKEVETIKEEMGKMKEKYEAFSKTPGAAKAPKVLPSSEANTTTSLLDTRIENLNKLSKENFFAIK
jgi:hypothetical protein